MDGWENFTDRIINGQMDDGWENYIDRIINGWIYGWTGKLYRMDG